MVSSEEVAFGTKITAPEVSKVEGYTFSWSNLVATMPNNDLTVTGSYISTNTGSTETANFYYGTYLSSEYDAMTTQDIVAGMVASGQVIENISTVNEEEYSFNLPTPTVDFNPDDLDDDAFEAYENDYRYSMYFVIPQEVETFTLIEAGFIDVTNKYKKDANHSNFEIDGKMYDIWVRSNNDGTRFDITVPGMTADVYKYKMTVNN